VRWFTSGDTMNIAMNDDAIWNALNQSVHLSVCPVYVIVAAAVAGHCYTTTCHIAIHCIALLCTFSSVDFVMKTRRNTGFNWCYRWNSDFNLEF